MPCPERLACVATPCPTVPRAGAGRNRHYVPCSPSGRRGVCPYRTPRANRPRHLCPLSSCRAPSLRCRGCRSAGRRSSTGSTLYTYNIIGRTRRNGRFPSSWVPPRLPSTVHRPGHDVTSAYAGRACCCRRRTPTYCPRPHTYPSSPTCARRSLPPCAWQP